MKKSADFLRDLARQVEDGLIELDEAFEVIAGNEPLTDDQRNMVAQAIADVRSAGGGLARIGGHTGIRGEDGDEAYAYKRADGQIAWGFNSAARDGFCIARGLAE